MAASRVGYLVRRFSTSVVRPKLVNPPINIFGIEGRYAHAIYSAASKEKKLEAVEKEMKDIQALLKREPKLAEALLNPSIQRTNKRDVVTAVFKKQNFSNISVNFFAAMAENGRMNKMNAVIGAFNKIMSAHRGEVQCTVTTAKPLEQGHLSELRTALQAFLQKGQVLQLETKVDPSLIGGMVVNIGDKYVDMSMATKLKTYTNLLKQAI